MTRNYKLERQTCKSKKRYDKKGALTLRNLFYKREHKELKIYPCPFCSYWHLTSKGRGL